MLDPLTFAILIIALGFTPALMYLWFFYRRDKWEPEPFKLVLTVFLFGFIACQIAGFFNSANLIIFFGGNQDLMAAVSAPVVEELLKWGVVFFAVFGLTQFNEPLDGFVYGAAVGLGFAAFENVGYMFNAAIIGGTDQLYLSAAERGIFMATGHPVFTGTSCFFLGMAKFMPKGLRRYAVALGGLGLAMGLHATWNGVIVGYVSSIAGSWGNSAFYLAAIVFMGVALLLVSTYTNLGLNRSPFNPTRWTPLPSAGLASRVRKAVSGAAQVVPSRFCPQCGTHLAQVTRFCPTCGTEISAEGGTQGGS
jgi:RsiW-degrading membrane proteinase PrsW (M82 family)